MGEAVAWGQLWRGSNGHGRGGCSGMDTTAILFWVCWK